MTTKLRPEATERTLSKSQEQRIERRIRLRRKSNDGLRIILKLIH